MYRIALSYGKLFKILPALLFLFNFQYQAFSDDEITENEDSSIRIENEYKISVPSELEEKVWEYLQDRYDNAESSFLKLQNEDFSVQLSDEIFVDRYFDDDKLTLIGLQSGIRHRTRTVISDPSNRKNGRELLQIKLNRPGDLEVNRSEIKFKVKRNPEPTDFFDSHPVFGLLDGDDREAFTQHVEEIGINPFKLKNTITLEQKRRRVYISLHNQPFATITLDRVTSHKWWKSVAFTEIELELNEIAYTDANPEQRVKMQAVNDSIKTDLMAKFPELIQDQLPKYNKTFNIFNESFIFFPLALELNMPVELLLTVGILVLVGVLLLWRKQKLKTSNHLITAL
jgi:hypothetical protein